MRLKAPDVESLMLTTVDNKTSLNFIVNTPVSLEQACSYTREIAERVLDVLTWFYNKKFGRLSLENQYLESIDENGNKITTISINAGIGMGVEIIPLTRVEFLDTNLIKVINLSCDRKRILCKQFRFAVQSDDAVTRYMFLYNILLQVHNDKQEEVENFIRKQEPAVQDSQSPRFPKIRETIYTRLRNEIAHLRSNATLETTSKKIEYKVQDLQYLVKKAIEKI